MTAKVVFTNGEREFPTPKLLRAWVRKMGLTVRNAQKNGTTYIFDCEGPVDGPGKPISPARAETGRFSSLGPDVQELEVLRPHKPSEDDIVPPDFFPDRPPPSEPHKVVLGSDLEAGDHLLSFAPTWNLTIDARGVGSVLVPASTSVPNSRDRYFNGFYSVESGGISSFRIEPDRNYYVRLEDG